MEGKQRRKEAVAEEEAARTKDILLMILPNALIDSNRKLKVSVKEYDELLAEVVSKFELPDDTFLSHVVADGGTPEPLTSLDDFGAKQKVQAWSAAQLAAAAAPLSRWRRRTATLSSPPCSGASWDKTAVQRTIG